MTITKPGDELWPLLFKPAERVTDVAQVQPFIEPMKRIMRGGLNDRGIGLAAPQVGIGLSFFIYGLRDGRLTTVINPVILAARNYRHGQEGCLSFPGRYAQVERAQNIWVRFTNIHGEDVDREMSGMNAIVFQHEADHLKGTCIFR